MAVPAGEKLEDMDVWEAKDQKVYQEIRRDKMSQSMLVGSSKMRIEG